MDEFMNKRNYNVHVFLDFLNNNTIQLKIFALFNFK